MSGEFCDNNILNDNEMISKTRALEILNIKEEELKDNLKEKYETIKTKIENLEKTKKISSYDSKKCMENVKQAYDKLAEIVAFDNAKESLVEIERQLLIDTRFRKSTEKCTTNFSIELDTTLTNVYSLRLNTITIPTTWYVFSSKKANTCLEIEVDTLPPSSTVVCIQDGTYQSEVDFVTELNSKLTDITVTYSDLTYRITLKNTSVNKIKLYFYKSNAWNEVSGDNLYKNNNLGWNMGFRNHEKMITDNDDNVYIELESQEEIIGDSPVDISGPKYLVLALDDFNSNNSNNSVVTLSPSNNTPSLPNYYNAAKNSSAPGGIYVNTNPVQYSEFICVENKVNSNYPFLFENPNFKGIPSLNAAQLTSINSTIQTQQKKNHNFPHSSISNAFAIIPLEPTTDKLIVLGAGDEIGRLYIKPVSINKLQLKLYDDFGRILDINNDWICNILVKTYV